MYQNYNGKLRSDYAGTGNSFIKKFKLPDIPKKGKQIRVSLFRDVLARQAAFLGKADPQMQWAEKKAKRNHKIERESLRRALQQPGRVHNSRYKSRFGPAEHTPT